MNYLDRSQVDCGPQNSALVNRYGQELLECMDGCQGRLSAVAEGEQGSEEGRPDLWSEAGRDGQEAF